MKYIKYHAGLIVRKAGPGAGFSRVNILGPPAATHGFFIGRRTPIGQGQLPRLIIEQQSGFY